MSAHPPTAYDEVLYPSGLYPQTHPDRLATIATLFGMQPAQVEQARVLELGSGDGSNLIAMAFALPGGRFYGIDLAAEPVGRGNQTLETLGLKNATLRQLDILQLPADWGTFDFILVHGLYSWVPDVVREKILAVCRAHLSEQGVAYISYNAYPGNHLRDLARRMMQFHVQQFPVPAEQIRQARTLLKFVAEAKTKRGHWQDVVQHQFERIQKYIDAGFYHDDLSTNNQPFYFHEFMTAAARHQLQFLAEADFTDMQSGGLTEEAVAVFAKMEHCNLIAHEQYRDFIEGRSFRQTLLCHRERTLNRDLKPERVFNLFVAADTAPVKAAPDLMGPTMEDFQRAKAVIATSHPVLKTALRILGKAWPRRLPFPELLNAARARVGQSDDSTRDANARDLGEFLIRCYSVGFVDLHVHPSIFVAEVSERPVASPLARLQLERGPVVASLRHLTIKFDDVLGQTLVRLLDGTNDRNALRQRLGELLVSGKATIQYDGKPVANPQQAQELLAVQLEAQLESLARSGLLVA